MSAPPGPLARRERAALCDLLEHVGPDAPTLCQGWTTYELAAHLALRDASPLALVGTVVPVLEQVTDKAMAWVQRRQEYGDLVRRLRSGPPWYSPMRHPQVDRRANALEYYIHHEDVRRAGPTPAPPRELSHRDQNTLWAATRAMGRLLGRSATVGVELVRDDVADSFRISRGEPTVVVRGLPNELALFAYGRGSVAQVEVGGDEDAVRTLRDGTLGI